MEETIGFVYDDSLTTTVDYLSVKVILTGTSSRQQYTLARTEAFKYTAEVDNTAFIAGSYDRTYIGVLANKEVVISTDGIYFKSNPLYSYKKVNYYEKMVDNITAFLLDPASIRHQQYTVEGKSITRLSHSYLVNLRERYTRRAALERKGIDTSMKPKAITLEF